MSREARPRRTALCVAVSYSEPAANFRRTGAPWGTLAGLPARQRWRRGRILPRTAARLMPQFRNLRRVRHTASDMFDLVADVERYPEFVPLCQSLRVRKRTTGEGGVETLVADMTVAYK